MLKHGASCLAAAATICALAAPATAAQYEIDVDVADEDDITELFVTSQISEQTFNVLIELSRSGIDLNTASREALYVLPNLTYDDVDAIIAYREEAGEIVEPAALVAADALPQDKLEKIAPFLTVKQPDRTFAATNGRVRYQTAWAPNDTELPSAAMQLRVASLRYLTVGAAGVLTRYRLGEVSWDPNRQALSAEPEQVRMHFPKYFAQWDTGDWAVIAGTFRAGFGQRLTFDTTDRFSPNGFYPDDAVFWTPGMSLTCNESAGELSESPCSGSKENDRATRDFTWRDGMTGVAAGLKHLGGPDGWAQLYAFASYQTKPVYQYAIYDRERCEDPRNDDDDACRAPDVYRRRNDQLEPTSRYKFKTLPDMYVEQVGGGNASYFFNRRSHVGITGYAAETKFLTEGADLDFQEWQRTPFNGSFGAVGLDGSWGHDWADVFVEVARSFDNQLTGEVDALEPEKAGGGFAGIMRTTATWDTNEVELLGRYYDENYANPFAGPISAPDQYDGLRARDEAGGRIRYTGKVADKLRLRTSADFWVQPSENIPNTDAFVRGDYDLTEQVRPGLWIEYRNKDLGSFSRDNCFQISTEFDERGEEIPCGGERIELTPRVRIQPSKRLYVTLQYEHQWIDDSTSDGRFDNEFRQDIQTFALLGANPIDPLRIRARVRYKMEDIESNQRLEQSLWSYLDVAYRFEMGMKLRARYDVIFYLDDRTSSQERDPNPEMWARLELEQRF